MDCYSESLRAVDDNVNILSSKESVDKVTETLRPLESAKLRVSLAYGIASLQFILLQLQGEETLGHPVHDQLTRIKGYVGTIKELESTTPAKNPKLSIDKDATQRLIQFELNKNMREMSTGVQDSTTAETQAPKAKRAKRN